MDKKQSYNKSNYQHYSILQNLNTECFLRESSQFKDWYMSRWNCMSSSHGLKKLPPNSYNWLQVFLNKAQYLIWSYIKQTGNLANVYNYQGKNMHKEQVRKRTKHTMSWAALLNANSSFLCSGKTWELIQWRAWHKAQWLPYQTDNSH